MSSLSGWISEQLGQIPQQGDQFQYQDLRITVVSVDSHRVLEANISRQGEFAG